MVTRRSIERGMDELRGDEPGRLELWTRFIEGRFDTNPSGDRHPQIDAWLRASQADFHGSGELPGYVGVHPRDADVDAADLDIEHPDGLGDVERRARETVIEAELRHDIEHATGTEASDR